MHITVENFAVTIPFLPLSAIALFLYSDPIRYLGLIPPLLAFTQPFLKPRARLDIESMKEIKVVKDNKRGFRLEAKVKSRGRPIIENIDAKLEFEPSVFVHEVRASLIEEKRSVMSDESWAFSNLNPAVAEHPKLKEGESFAISYPPEEHDLGSAPNNQGQVVRMFQYGFFAYPPIGQLGKVRLLVQGEGPDGNTVSVKKKITVSDVKKITDSLP